MWENTKCVFTYIHLYIHTYLNIYMCIHTHIFINTQMDINVYIFMCTVMYLLSGSGIFLFFILHSHLHRVCVGYILPPFHHFHRTSPDVFRDSLPTLFRFTARTFASSLLLWFAVYCSQAFASTSRFTSGSFTTAYQVSAVYV